jgi:hypothetical protein
MQATPAYQSDALDSAVTAQDELRKVIVANVTAEDVAAITRAVERAKGGDIAAARLVLSYVLGKPGAKKAEPAKSAKTEAAQTRAATAARMENEAMRYRAEHTGRHGLYGSNATPLPSNASREEVWDSIGKFGRRILKEIEEKKRAATGGEVKAGEVRGVGTAVTDTAIVTVP